VLYSDVHYSQDFAVFKGAWSPKLIYTFYPFSWKCRTLW